MNNIKFIHAADIHLGSILHTIEKKNSFLVENFSNAVYRAFERICNIAIEEKVKFVLLSGDVYDKDLRSVKANSFFISQCKRLDSENIKVLVIGGNHDPIKPSKELFELPSNVFIFSADAADIVELMDESGAVYCRIVGQSYKDGWDGRKMHHGFKTQRDEIFTIAMLHTQLDNNTNYVPCTLRELKDMENIDYWALGHIHNPQVLNNKEPGIFYPGIPQGRDFGEEGQGGALLVEIINNKLEKVSFIPTSLIIWQKVILRIDENEEKAPQNLNELEELIIEKLNDMNPLKEVKKKGFTKICEGLGNVVQGYIISCSLSGRGNIYNIINDKEEVEEYLLESLNSKLVKLRPFIYMNSIELNIGKPIKDFEGLISENSTFKVVSDTSKKLILDTNLKNQLLKELEPLWEENENVEDINIKKLQLDKEGYESIINQAEQLIIELLLQRSEKHEN